MHRPLQWTEDWHFTPCTTLRLRQHRRRHRLVRNGENVRTGREYRQYLDATLRCRAPNARADFGTACKAAGTLGRSWTGRLSQPTLRCRGWFALFSLNKAIKHINRMSKVDSWERVTDYMHNLVPAPVLRAIGFLWFYIDKTPNFPLLEILMTKSCHVIKSIKLHLFFQWGGKNMQIVLLLS